MTLKELENSNNSYEIIEYADVDLEIEIAEIQQDIKNASIFSLTIEQAGDVYNRYECGELSIENAIVELHDIGMDDNDLLTTEYVRKDLSLGQKIKDFISKLINSFKLLFKKIWIKVKRFFGASADKIKERIELLIKSNETVSEDNVDMEKLRPLIAGFDDLGKVTIFEGGYFVSKTIISAVLNDLGKSGKEYSTSKKLVEDYDGDKFPIGIKKDGNKVYTINRYGSKFNSVIINDDDTLGLKTFETDNKAKLSSVKVSVLVNNLTLMGRNKSFSDINSKTLSKAAENLLYELEESMFLRIHRDKEKTYAKMINFINNVNLAALNAFVSDNNRLYKILGILLDGIKK